MLIDCYGGYALGILHAWYQQGRRVPLSIVERAIRKEGGMPVGNPIVQTYNTARTQGIEPVYDPSIGEQ